MKRFYFNLFTLLLFHTFSSGQNKSKILVSDLARIKQIVSLDASPDGKKAIFSFRSIEPNPDNKLEYDYRTHLHLLDLQNNTTQVLTRGSESISNPVFSPDGKSVAFTRIVKTRPQIFIMPLEGGEAWQLTDAPYGANLPRFSPDGKKILFNATVSLTALLGDSILNSTKGMPAWSLEKPGFAKNEHLIKDKKIKGNPDGSLEEIRAYLEKDVEDKKAKVFNRLNFQGEANVEPEMFISHLYITDVQEGAKPKPITQGFWTYNGAKWANDGNSIWANVGADRTKHPDRVQENVLINLKIDGTGERTVLAEKGKSVGAYEVSPDGKTIACILNTPNLLSFSQLALANADGTNLKIVNFDRNPDGLRWSNDGKYLYFTAPSNGGFPLYRLDVKTQKIETLSDFDTGINAFDLTNTQIITAQTNIRNPSEIYVSDLNMKNTVRVTKYNDEWLKDRQLSLPEKRVYTNSKGQKVEYWLMKPTFAETGKKYPLLLQLHGGPTAMWGPGEFSMWHELQYFCSQGYGLVYPNQRGSGGYGKDFQFANYRDWGVGPAEDALAACSDAAKESWVDTARQVITGGSYAGYLTAWIIAHDHRFKAAFAQRGVYDLTTFMGEGNAWRLVPNYFGLPWENEAQTKIDFNSPYSYVDKIRTPFLIKHGENDLRTGVIQSQMMFRSLKYLGKDVEYVLMPNGTHELSRTGNVRQRIDRILRIYEFFERYVR